MKVIKILIGFVLLLGLFSCQTETIEKEIVGEWNYNRVYSSDLPEVEMSFNNYDNSGEVIFNSKGDGKWDPDFEISYNLKWELDSEEQRITLIRNRNNAFEMISTRRTYDWIRINENTYQLTKQHFFDNQKDLVVTEHVDLSRIE